MEVGKCVKTLIIPGNKKMKMNIMLALSNWHNQYIHDEMLRRLKKQVFRTIY